MSKMDYSEKLPDFSHFYPSPASNDSGVMSPMTPLSNYTQGSTPEQNFMTSPEHLQSFSSDEGVVCSQFLGEYETQTWNGVSVRKL